MLFQTTEKIFQWHGETFDIPKSTRHLAFSSLCANQAFRYGDNVYGFQFHLEVDEPMIHRWLRVAENRKEIAALGGTIDPERIHRDTPEHIARLASAERARVRRVHQSIWHRKEISPPSVALTEARNPSSVRLKNQPPSATLCRRNGENTLWNGGCGSCWVFCCFLAELVTPGGFYIIFLRHRRRYRRHPGRLRRRQARPWFQFILFSADLGTLPSGSSVKNCCS